MSDDVKEILEKIRDEVTYYALLNAVEHGGKARPGPVINKVLGRHPELRRKEVMPELGRFVAKVVKEVNSLTLEEQERRLSELKPPEEGRKKERKAKEGLPPLPNASEGRVVTRFAPNPDFLIHLGNARPAILSCEYARMYKGKMILRFEDTDPKTKPPMPEAYRLIREDLEWLGVRWDEEYIQSLRMEIYYDLAKELIRRGGAYVDLCSQKEFLKYKLERKPCPHRNQGVEENLELFEKMISGHFSEGEAVLRVKTDITHKDPSVIDWVALRIIDTDKHPHPIVGSKYVVWPTYNFAAAVDDHLLGVTHILRGKEHAVNTVKQGYLYAHFGWEYPTVINLGRLKLEGLILSKSQIKKLMEENPGKFSGPDDIRFGTIASLRNRGIEAETLRRIILQVGTNPNDATISWDNIAALNRSIIDSATKRVMAVFDPIKLVIESYEGPKKTRLPYHPDNEGLGAREIEVSMERDKPVVYISKKDLESLTAKGKALRVRLMGLCNVEIIATEGRTKAVARYLGSSVEQAKQERMRIIQWVPVTTPVTVRVKVPEGLELIVDEGVAEPSLTQASPGERYQFVRYGFIKVRSVTRFKGGVRVEAVFMHK